MINGIKEEETIMSKRPFDKELFKRSVVYNVKTLYRTPIEEATQHQIFHAVALATKDAIIDAWSR